MPFRSLLTGLWSRGWFPNSLRLTLTFGLPDSNRLLFKWPSQVKIVVDDVYERGEYDRFWDVQQGFKVLDVGAYIGVYTLKAAKKAGCQGRVISVEPEEENFRFLQKNIQINGFNNVIPVRAALSDFEGNGSLYLSARGSGEHSMLSKSKKEIKVPVYTVDALMRKLRIDSLDVMKIDVEGAEIQVLKGSNQMLREGRIHRIAIAAYHYPDECREVVDFLTAFHYKVDVDRSYVYASSKAEYSSLTHFM
jgi:FkbM family methyltransferase